MAALQFTSVPGYSALILRRTLQDLKQPGSLITRSKEWLKPHVQSGLVRWSGQDRQWTFTCLDANERVIGESVIKFGYLEKEDDKYQYQGAELGFVAFDELTQFTLTQYQYLFTRLRRPEGIAATNPLAAVPPRIRSASNPGGRGHQWVRERFMDSPSDETTFHPAGLDDNPFVDRAEYARSLDHVDPVLRAQILDGNWDIREPGGYFRREYFEVLENPAIAVRRVRYWDLAATEKTAHNDPDYTVGTRLALLSDGTIVVEDVQRFRKNPASVEAHVKATAAADPPGTPVWIEQEPGSSGKQSISNWQRYVLPGYAVFGHKKTKSKQEMVVPASARASQGHIKLLRGPWIKEWFEELEAYPNAPHDDQCLVGETLVVTPEGERRIDAIRSGDVVLGQSGWVEVLNAGMTSPAAEVSTRFGLTATAGHPVWTEEHGFIPFLKVAHDAKLSICAEIAENAPSQFMSPNSACAATSETDASLTEPNHGSPEPLHPTHDLASQPALLKDASDSRPLTAIATSTTPAGNGTEIPSPSRRPNGEPSESNESPSMASSSVATLTLEAQAIATTTSPGGSGSSGECKPFTKKSGSQFTDTSLTDMRSITSTETPPTTTSATSNVSVETPTIESIPLRGERSALAPSNWRTSLAFAISLPRGTPAPKVSSGTGSTLTSPSSSPAPEEPRVAPVYNLTTSDGTYYANRVLVHNCDSFTGAFAMLLGLEGGRVRIIA